MTRPGIKSLSPGPLVNTLRIRPNIRTRIYTHIYIERESEKESERVSSRHTYAQRSIATDKNTRIYKCVCVCVFSMIYGIHTRIQIYIYIVV